MKIDKKLKRWAEIIMFFVPIVMIFTDHFYDYKEHVWAFVGAVIFAYFFKGSYDKRYNSDNKEI
jgi:hypothetical protein